MKIIGLTRIRNEAEIITDTLNHMAEFCDSVFVYDDCSFDNTVELCKKHPIVARVIKGRKWDKTRKRAEWQNRKYLLNEAKLHATKDDWFVYMDADERIEYYWKGLEVLPKRIIAIRMKLFDFYITPKDVSAHYTERKYIGPEYRNIIMAFRNLPTLDYSSPDQREVHLRSKGIVSNTGYVKHYGKAISIKQFDDTCNYYADHFPKYSAKWKARRGKAIHTKSDFGRELITWGEKETKGILLTKAMNKQIEN